jgi:hypothetical protein
VLITTFTPPATTAWAMAERFARLIAGLVQAISDDVMQNATLMNIAARLWNHLAATAVRFAAIAEKPLGRARRPGTPAEPGAEPATEPARARTRRPKAAAARRLLVPRQHLPTGHGWLVRLSPRSVPFGIELAYFLVQPEMTELLATAPRLWRVLRPICRMLGITPHNAPPYSRPAPRDPAKAAATAQRARDRRRQRAEERRAHREAVRRHGPQGKRPSFFRS